MTAENLQANHAPELPGTAELPGKPSGYPAEVLARLEADAALVIARYPQPRSALLPLLHLVQSEDGYITQRGVELCARLLELSTAEVAGVATFYTQFKRHPNGEYTVGVCTNTLCAIMGGDAVYEALSEHLDIGHDETTDDGRITLERLECNAACDFAPVMMVNWEFFDNQTPASKGWSAPTPEAVAGGAEPPVEQVAAEHAAAPSAPSAHDAGLKGQAGDEARADAAHQKED
jgi:NADH-quinone oxidoreductase subunit E